MATDKIDPKEPAYPTHGFSEGMDIRTKFSLEFAKIYADRSTFTTPKEEIAEMAVDMADALIKKLNKS